MVVLRALWRVETKAVEKVVPLAIQMADLMAILKAGNLVER